MLINQEALSNSHPFYQKLLNNFFSINEKENLDAVNSYLLSLKEPTRRLWSSYRTEQVKVNYDDPLIQASYFLRYCPLYYSSIFAVLDAIKDGYEPSESSDYLEYSFMCAGPGSEALGLFEWLKENFPSELETYNEISLYDASKWGLPRKVIKQALQKTLDENGGYSINEKTADVNFTKDLFFNTNQKIILFQNCLNEILSTNIHRSSLLNNILKMIRDLVRGGLLIFIDREGYKNTIDFFTELEEILPKNCRQIFTKEMQDQVNSSPPILIPDILNKNLFDWTNGLKPSRKNKIVCRVFQKN